ncbi:MAG: hypothetical protein KGZ39_00515 [Simkania sp.]|nr:hypothetical protein [Simkania sp.]
MKIVYLFLTILALSGCTTQKVSYTQLAHRQMNQFAQEMEGEKKFILSGCGGAMMDCISEFDLDFESPYPLRLTIPEARELIIEFTERFKDEVNSNEEIRPYLCIFPINQNNIRMELSFWETPRKLVSQEFVAHAWLREGRIYYTFFDHEQGKFSGKCFKESYEEALKLVHKN